MTNARVHTGIVAMAEFHELRYKSLPHPPYSPDLAPPATIFRFQA